MLTNRYNSLMIRTCAISWTLNAVLLSSIVVAQQPSPGQRPGAQPDTPRPKTETQATKPQPLSELPLEELLDRALSRNPAIRKAQVELSEAQVALDRVRQQVARDVTAARMAVEVQRLQIEVAKSRLDEAEQLVNLDRAAATGKRPESSAGSENAQTIQARSKLTEAKAALRLELAKLPDLESRLQYITGEPATLSIEAVATAQGTVTFSAEGPTYLTQKPGRLNPSDDPSTAEMRKKLLEVTDMPIQLDFVEMPISDALQYLSDFTKIRFVIHHPVAEEVGTALFDAPITLSLEETPFPAALAALQDQAPRLRFVLRPYGVLITAERGEPIGSMTVEEFYRQHKLAAAADKAK